MNKISFSQFAQLLYPIMSGDNRAEDFCLELFENITKNSVHKYLRNLSEETWKAYYKETRKINLLAKKVFPKTDVTKFGAFVSSLDESVQHCLAEKLKTYVPETNDETVCSDCADLFLEIIQDAAENYRKKKPIEIPKRVSDSDVDVVQIESDLKVIVNGLSKISQSHVIALRKKAIELPNKIEEQNVLLLGKINWLVDAYYYYVEELFKAVGTIRGKKFKIIASEIALKYQKTSSDASLNQDQIFDSLVDWLKGVFPDASRVACEIVISFFVQNCEVFDELP